jgi:uncharacterized protein YjeT (DUF2065 family)
MQARASSSGSTQQTTPVRSAGRLVTAALVLGALNYLVFGLWAFFAPSHFQSVLAPWASLGEHFLRDGGAFSIGLGTSVVAALFWRDAITVVLTGISVASLLHVISHTIDADYGAAAFLGAMGLLYAVACVARVRSERQSGVTNQIRPM